MWLTCNQKMCVLFIPFRNIIHHWFAVTGSHDLGAIILLKYFYFQKSK